MASRSSSHSLSNTDANINAKKASIKEREPYRKPLAIGRHSHGYYLLLRETSNKGEHELVAITSRDGEKFSGAPVKITLCHKNRTKEDLSKCRDFRLFSHEDEMVMTYTRHEEGTAAGATGTHHSLVYAITKDRKTWVIAGVIKKVHAGGVLVPELVPDAGDAIYLGGDVLRVALSKNARNWSIIEPHRVPHWHFFDGASFRVIAGVPLEKAIAVFYESEMAIDIFSDVSLHDQKVGEERFIKMGVALFSHDSPTRLLWQTELPLIELPLNKIGNFSIIGVVPGKKLATTQHLRIYGASPEGAISYIEFSERVLVDHRERRPAALKKHPANPIIEPVRHDDKKSAADKSAPEHQWESDATFNPTALDLDGKVHLLYRAVGEDGLSRIGYAASRDGVTIDERLKKPIFKLDTRPAPMGDDDVSFGMFHSGGSWGGSEDPKVSRIGGRIYLTYVAHNGWWPMRTAVTWISEEDFLKKRWKWSKPQFMSPPHVGSKSVVILPEKVNGQYVIFHRIWPDIMVDFVPSLEFGDEWTEKTADGSVKKHAGRWLTGQHKIPPRHSYWDSRKLSMGAAPIKTDAGWLAVYNAVDKRDSSKYKIGAMLLDASDPRKVLARSRKPILSPDQWYENDGKPGIAYPGGVVERDGTLYVYYGGGDKVSCVATIPTDEILWHLERDSEPRFDLKPVSLG